MLADPQFMFHLKDSIQADLPSRGQPIVDEVERRLILTRITGRLEDEQNVDDWVAHSPLVEVKLIFP